MTLWDKLTEINNENENTIDVKLIVNNVCIVDWLNYHVFEIYTSVDILSLEEDDYILEEMFSNYSDMTNRYFRIIVNIKEGLIK